MKPYGISPKKHYNFEDCHPAKGFVNWWEDIAKPDKGSERQKVKIEIIKNMNEESK